MIFRKKQTTLFCMIMLGFIGLGISGKVYGQSYEWFTYGCGSGGGGGSSSGTGSGTGDGGSGSGSGSDTPVGMNSATQAALERAKQASNDAAEAQKVLTQMENRIAALEKEIANLEASLRTPAQAESPIKKFINLITKSNVPKAVTPENYTKITNADMTEFIEKKQTEIEIAEKRNQLDQMKMEAATQKTVVDARFDEMYTAYKTLSEAYTEYSEAGDPVQVGNGKFIAQYVDFVAEDYLNRFCITRNRTDCEFAGSFGKNWNCELDTRIIRAYEEVNEEFYSELKQLKTDLLNAKETHIDEYRKKFPDLKNFDIESGDFYIQYVTSLIDTQMTSMDKLRNTKNEVIQKNKYVSYGKFAASSSYAKVGGILIFVDKNGNEYELFENENGEWRSTGSVVGKKFFLKKKNGGGFEVVYGDGTKINYNDYGILESEVDLNGNITRFEATNGKITKVILKTGENVTVKRNSDGTIAEISGPVSGKAEYTYSNGRISSVTDNSDVSLKYAYDSEGSLTKITKADGKSISIRYEKEKKSGKKVCSGVTNENGESESFSYDFEKGIVKHTGTDGLQEIFELTPGGMTKAYEDGKGNRAEFKINELGIVCESVKGGVRRKYEFDENYHPTKVIYDDGSYESMKYNQYGNVMQYADRDGFVTSYAYDGKGNICGIYFCGNLITSVVYNSNGLVNTIFEKGITYHYEYNQFGNVVRKWWVDSNGTDCCEKWEYDSKNRLVKYTGIDGIDNKYSYSAFGKTIVFGNSKREDIVYNARNWPVEITETDLRTKKKYTLEYLYNGTGDVTQVNLNGKLYTEYVYNQFGKICNVTVFAQDENPYSEEYDFDSFGFNTKMTSVLGDEKVEKYKVKYVRNGDVTQVKVYSGDVEDCCYTYDKTGKLTGFSKNDGYLKSYVYSKAGRILGEKDSNGKEKTYRYNTDGTVLVEELENGKIVRTLEYDGSGNLLKSKNVLNEEIVYSYDSFGNLTSVKNGSGSIVYQYDSKNRKILEAVRENNGEICYEKRIEYDDKNQKRTSYEGNYVEAVEYLDAWNRIVKRENAGGEYLYEYDWNGNIVKVVNPEGKIQTFEYSAAGKPLKRESENSVKTWIWDAGGRLLNVMENDKSLYKAEYDMSGRMVKEINFLGTENQFEYDENGFVSVVGKYDTGTIKIKAPENGKIAYLDGKGNEYLYEIGKSGKIEKETDFEQNVILYNYDVLGRIKQKVFGSGLTAEYSYYRNENMYSVSFSNGEKLEFWKNALGQIRKIQNAEYENEYEYDAGGRLQKQKNVQLQTQVDYGYDEFGRCVQKTGEMFDVSQEYDSCGRICRIEDNVTKAEVLYGYDGNGNIILEQYSNGLKVLREYNANNMQTKIVAKNRAGAEIWGQNIVFDSKNRVSKISELDGSVYEYEYDEKGRLVKSISPYTQNQVEHARKEAEECGFLVKENEIHLERAGNGYKWTEIYEYTESGSVSSVTTPLGKIIYEYDRMNRIVSKHSANTQEGMSFEWNKNNCLEMVKSALRTVTFTYGALMRPVKVEEINLVTGDRNYVLYEYDCFGRRVSETVNGIKTVYLFDGMTNNVISSSVVTQNGRILLKEKTESEEICDDYRWINTQGYSENGADKGRGFFEDYRTEQTDGKRTEADVRPGTAIYMNGKHVMNTYAGASESTEFLLSDWKGNVIAVFDSVGNCVEKGMFDLWGNEIAGNGRGSYGRGRNHAEIDGLMLVDLGMRDYVPGLKCFTTVDNARDGGNWFAYCACDPLNYTDINGYFKDSYTDKECADYAAEISKIGKFNKTEYSETGESAGILYPLDCADVSSMIDKLVTDVTGKGPSSKRQETFNKYIDEGRIDAAKNSVQAENFYSEDGTNYVRTGGKDDLSNANIITPGTVLVFRDDPATTRLENHTITITAIDYDENGAVVGISCIEGHTGGGRTETEYIDLRSNSQSIYVDDIYTLDAWAGIFAGSFEIQAPSQTEGNESEGGCVK